MVETTFLARHGVTSDDPEEGYVTLADDGTLRGLVQIHTALWEEIGSPEEVLVRVSVVNP